MELDQSFLAKANLTKRNRAEKEGKFVMNIKSQLLAFVVFAVWTLAIIYGTYRNTVSNAELVSITESGYEICYNNTGDVFTYK